MVYAAIFLMFAVPAVAMFTYGLITERLADPTNLLAQEKSQEEIQKQKRLNHSQYKLFSMLWPLKLKLICRWFPISSIGHK